MDEEMASLPPLTRLIYIALWNEADDEGRLRANPKYLKGALFPYDNFDIKPHLDSLKAHGKLSEYSVRAQTYAVINNFSRHQRINRASPSKLPPPPDNLAEIQDTAVAHGGLSDDSVRAHPRNREQGTGNREHIKQTPQTPQGAGCSEEVGVLLSYWNSQSGQRRRRKAFGKLVTPRLKEGFTVDDIKQVIDWLFLSREKRAVYLRDNGHDCPETIFRLGNFEKYLDLANKASRALKVVESSKPDGWVGPAIGSVL